jgi:hypothetical protein
VSMDVEIGEVVTTIRAVDGSTLASPEVLRQIVKVVLRAVEEREAHSKRVNAERRVTGGVSQERDAEE